MLPLVFRGHVVDSMTTCMLNITYNGGNHAWHNYFLVSMRHPILFSVITGMHISVVHILSLGSPYTGSSTSDPSLLQVAVTFDQIDKGGLELHYPYGFELGCSPSKGEQTIVVQILQEFVCFMIPL